MLGLIAAAVAAVASLAFAAAASASPVLKEAGTTVPVGTTFNATSSNLKITGGAFGNVECTSVSLLEQLTKNSGSSIAVSGLTASSTCFSGKEAIRLTELAFPSWSTSVSGSGSISTQMIVDTLKVECIYTGTGTITYPLGASAIKAEIELEPLPEICGELGPVVLTANFNLETQAGTALIIG